MFGSPGRIERHWREMGGIFTLSQIFLFSKLVISFLYDAFLAERYNKSVWKKVPLMIEYELAKNCFYGEVAERVIL